MAEDDSQEKTEEASGRKIEKAREQGQAPRSRDLTTSIVLLLGAVGLNFFSDFMGKKFVAIMHNNFELSREVIFDPSAMLSHLGNAIFLGLLSMTPFLAVMLIASIAGPIALGGWLFSAEALLPNLSRMDPLAGLKRMFSMKSVIELVKSVGKVTLILGATLLVLRHYSQAMFRLTDENIELAIIDSIKISAYALIALSASTILIAAIDVPIQLWDYYQKLKMSKQELKDEAKDTDGKPEVKGRIRQLQREIAQRRMMARVPEADVVITNPTHYAVALKYHPESMATPVLVAKGGDLIAMKIREIAKANGVEIMESPVLARAVYYTTEMEKEIPAGLYLAVAQVLAYVFQLRNYRRGRGKRPAFPRNIEVPTDMYFD